MASIKAFFHRKISLSVLPSEYYAPFKLFYKSIVSLGTFDVGALIEIIEISKDKPDYETFIANITMAFTIMTRKMQLSIEEEKKEETGKKPVKITLYHYSYLLAGLQFLIVNRQTPTLTSMWTHTSHDADSAGEWKYWKPGFRAKMKVKIILSYLKSLLPSSKKNSELIDVYTQRLVSIVEEVKASNSGAVSINDLPLDQKIFINTILIFLQELCLIAPMELEDKKQMKMVNKIK